MRESDYIAARNMGLIKAAREAIQNVLPGREYGVAPKDLLSAMEGVNGLMEKLHRRCFLDEEGSQP